jgi:hypothetical protein
MWELWGLWRPPAQIGDNAAAACSYSLAGVGAGGGFGCRLMDQDEVALVLGLGGEEDELVWPGFGSAGPEHVQGACAMMTVSLLAASGMYALGSSREQAARSLGPVWLTCRS